MDLEAFAKLSTDAWRLLVLQALMVHEDGFERAAESIASRTKTSVQTVRRKMKAIRAAASAGMTDEQIIEKGPSETLSLYAKAQSRSNEPQRMLSWRVSRSLADAIMSDDPSPDAEEALVTRLVRVCHLQTSEDLWTFVHSYFALVSDEELRHHASEEFPKKFKKVRK